MRLCNSKPTKKVGFHRLPQTHGAAWDYIALFFLLLVIPFFPDNTTFSSSIFFLFSQIYGSQIMLYAILDLNWLPFPPKLWIIHSILEFWVRDNCEVLVRGNREFGFVNSSFTLSLPGSYWLKLILVWAADFVEIDHILGIFYERQFGFCRIWIGFMWFCRFWVI